MKYKAEIFDYVQYLFQVTGFNDHQIHCVIKFDHKIDAATLEKAVKLLVKTIPMLSRVYLHNDGKSYWEDGVSIEWKELFTIVRRREDFEAFTFSKTKEESGPQIKVCLYQSYKDSVSIVMNHMVTDGGGFKQCIYLLSDIYSNLMRNPDYIPDYVIDGDRSFKSIMKEISSIDKMKALLLNSKDSNQSGDFKFPMSKEEKISPFILTHDLLPESYHVIQNFCRKNQVTVNDVLLTAYFRVLSKMLERRGEPLNIPIMIDMRRYLEDKSFHTLTNHTAIVSINITVDPSENFYETLAKVKSEMLAKKTGFLGINTFVKLDVLFRMFKSKFRYNIIKKSLKNPNICMTNIGVIDSSRLIFDKARIDHVFICGSIKYRPHFQMAVSTYRDKMTLSVNLYGSQQDRNNITKFFEFMEDELKL